MTLPERRDKRAKQSLDHREGTNMKKRISLAIIVILVLQMILGSAVSEAVCDGCGQTSGELHEYISGESTLYLCDACLLIAQPSAAAETEIPNNIEETPIVEEETPVEEAPVEEETPVEETPSEEEAPVEETPSEEAAPVEETPSEEETPVEDSATIVEEIPAEEQNVSEVVPEISVSVTASEVSEDGSATLSAAVSMNFESEISYDWQMLDGWDETETWQSLGESGETLALTGLTPEFCASTLYRCVVAAGALTATSEEIMLNAGIVEIAPVNEEVSDFATSKNNSSMTCTITGYTGTDTTVEIPETIDGYTVTAIGDHAFSGTKIESVTIPETVTSIGSYVFVGCASLSSVSIPSSVTTLGEGVFSNCSSLRSIVLPSSITTIPRSAFSYSGLESITIPSSVTSIQGSAFFECGSLQSISIPGSVKSIGSQAFMACTNLSSAAIASGVESIDSYAFQSCVDLESISIPDSVTSIGICAFCYCSSLTGATLPKNLTSIPDYMFAGCESLGSISIPESVTSIGEYALYGTGITSVSLPAGLTDLNNGVFSDCRKLASVTLPANLQSIGESTFSGCYRLTAIDIPESVTSIGGCAFNECIRLKSIKIPSKVTEIQYGTFMGCASLASATIPAGVTSIGSEAFYNCPKLATLALPSGIESLGEDFVGDNTEITYEGTNAVIDEWLQENRSGDFVYTVDEDTCTIVAYKGTSKDVVIPSEINGKKVTAIDDTFRNSDITSIVIPDTVTSLGYSAFRGCASLTSVTLPDTLTEIGESAFACCTSLESIVIPESVECLGESAFEECKNLTSVNLPAGITELPYAVFRDCTSLESITLPAGLTIIGEDAFGNCALTGITIPDTVTEVGEEAFAGCTNLTKIVIPDSVDNLHVGAFKDCTGLVSVQLPSGLTEIPDSLFENCTSLQSVTIPSKVTEIGADAFSGCTSLTGISLPEGVTAVYDRAFSGCTNLTSVVLPSTLKYIYEEAFKNCGLTSVSLPENLNSIDPRAFMNCAFTTITIPDSVTYLGMDFVDRNVEIVGSSDTVTEWKNTYRTKTYDYTIENGVCTIHKYYGNDAVVEIPSVIEGAPVTAINDCAFKNCSFVTSVTIPDSVTSIGEEAFRNCSGLTSITIPDSVTSIGDNAFMGCTSLKSIAIPDSVTSLGDAFRECTALESVKLPSGLTEITSCLFSGCTSLATIEIPEGVKDIYEEAFSGCTSLESIVIPEGVTYIGDYAFDGCESLKSVTLPSALTSIGEGAFEDCTGLESIVIPEGVKEISYYAFSNCTSLAEVTLPGSVKTIYDYAFNGCTALESIVIPEGVQEINADAFTNSGLKAVVLPNSIVRVDSEAFDKDVVIYGEEDSYAELWSDKNNRDFETGTPAKALSLNASALSLETGDIQTLTATVDPSDATVTWKSSNEKVATVDNEGKITAAGKCGTAVITAKAGTLTATCTVTIVENGEPAAHDYEVTYQWADDHSTCTATRTCKNCGLSETEKVNAAVTETDQSCTTDEATVYTATFAADWAETKTYSDVKQTATGHSWDATTYEWTDNYSECTATRTCATCGCTETATSAAEFVEYEPSTCEKEGYTLYKASDFGEDAKSWTETQYRTKPDTTPVEHDWGETTYTWSTDHSACTAKRVCKLNEESFEELNATVTPATTAATCTANGKTVYTATFAEGQTWAKAQTFEEPIQAPGHSWGATTYVWADDRSSCTATRACTRTGCEETETETVKTTSATTFDPTCTKKGKTTYTADFKADWTEDQTKEVEIAALGHDWQNVTYTWADDYSTCTMTRACKRNHDHDQTETVVAALSQVEPTCTEKGTNTYTATFADGTVKTQVVETKALDHLYSEKYTYNEDATCTVDGTESLRCVREGCTSVKDTRTKAGTALNHLWGETQYGWTGTTACTATRTCTRTGCTETETANATVSEYIEDTAPTCTADGTGHYTATFSVNWAEEQTLPATVSKLGHTFGAPEFTWNDTACTATFSCTRSDCGHSEEVSCTIASQVIPATCTENKQTVYTATVTFNNQTYTDQKTVTEEGTAGHVWGEPTYDWADDCSSCTAKRVCTLDETHTETANGSITSQETKPVSCREAGYTEFTAKFDVLWAKEQKKCLPGETIPHAYGDYMPNNDATCTKYGTMTATCKECESPSTIENPNDPPLGHDYREGKTVNGKTTFTCSRCGDSYTETAKGEKASHWYGEWTPIENDRHTASCKYEGCDHTAKVACERFEYRFLRKIETEEDFVFSFCPVCGNVDETHLLALIKDVAAEGEKLPKGEPVLRVGKLENGETILSVGFEYAGRITIPEGEITFTVPVKMLNACTFTDESGEVPFVFGTDAENGALVLLNEDGTETELPFTYDEETETISFTLHFIRDEETPENPIKVLHLIQK